jgi:Tol biopolymer transport system component
MSRYRRTAQAGVARARRVLLGLATLAICALALAGSAGAQVALLETVLGPVHPGVKLQTIQVARTADRYAYVTSASGKTFAVTIQGKGTEYDAIEPLRAFQFHPDGVGVVFAARRGGERYVVSGDSETKIDGELIHSGFVPSPLVSPDGRRVAFAVRRAGKAAVVVDGVEGSLFDDVTSLAFTATAQAIYIAKRNAKFLLVVNGKEDGPFDKVGVPTSSPDGLRIALAVTRPDGMHMRVNGSEGKAYPLMNSAIFSRNGKRIAYVAAAPAGAVLVIDEQESKPFSSIGEVALSPDGTRHAFVAVDDQNRERVVLDGVEQPVFLKIAGLTFSPDSKRLAYAAVSGKKRVVVLDGVPGMKYDDVDPSSMRFSPDGKHFAYLATAANRQVLVRDKTELAKLASLSAPVFTTDGQHIVQTGVKGASRLLVDGQPYGAFEFFVQPDSRTHFVDAKHFRLLGRRGNNFIQVDGTIVAGQ